MSRVAAAIITFNNASTIENCLRSVTWADEIVVVDSCSSDATVALCRKFTGCIHSRPFTNFGEQKNHLLSLTTTEWVLVVDADEQVTPELATELCDAIGRNSRPDGQPGRAHPAAKYDGYLIPRKNFIGGHWLRHGGFYPDHMLRLSRRGKGHYSDHPVHASLQLPPSRIGRLRHCLLHFWSDSREDWERKCAYYAALEAPWLKARGSRPIRNDTLLAMRAWCKWFEIVCWKQGWLDGGPALMLARGLANKIRLRHLRLRELWDQPDAPLSHSPRQPGA